MASKIGLLCGREYAFPPAFLQKVNTIGAQHGITAEFLKLTGQDLHYEVISRDDPRPFRHELGQYVKALAAAAARRVGRTSRRWA